LTKAQFRHSRKNSWLPTLALFSFDGSCNLLHKAQAGREGRISQAQAFEFPDEIIASCRSDKANEEPKTVVYPSVGFEGCELLLGCCGSGLSHLRSIDLASL
jgi:hypothetical protein